MRFLQPMSLAAVAAVAILAGCAGNGTGSTPSVGSMASHTSQTMSQNKGGNFKPAVIVKVATPAVSCDYSLYYACYSVDADNPFEAEWCISDSGDCSSGLVPYASWSEVTTTVKTGKVLKKSKTFSASWAPDPGNPSILTVTDTAKKIGKKAPIKYATSLSGCYTSGCFTDFVTYGFQV